MHRSTGSTYWLIAAILSIAFIARSPGGPGTQPALADGSDQPRAIDTAADGSLWLALSTDTGGGGARRLSPELEPLEGFATLGRTDRIAVDAAGDILLLEPADRAGEDRAPRLAVHAPDGRHQKSWSVDAGTFDFDASDAASSAWTLYQPTSSTAVPQAARFEGEARTVRGEPVGADARRIAGADDGSFYVASDPSANANEIRRYDAAGSFVESWTVTYPILAIDVASDGSVWVASAPPMMPDLSKTRIEGFAPDGGMPSGTAFADFEMDISAADIAAGSWVDGAGDAQCSVYGLGSFGIGALWTLVRHSCEGELLQTSRDIPQVGIWTPVPTATEGSASTPAPSTPTQTSATPTTPEPTTPPTEAATATPSATEPGEPEARIYLPMILRQARPGLDPAHLVDEDIDPKAWPHDPYQIRSAAVVGDVLRLTVSYGGGCESHDFQLVVSTLFLETFPVRARAFVAHEDHDDPCDALVIRHVAFDLEPLERAFKDAYPSDPGPLLIELEGWEEALRFEME